MSDARNAILGTIRKNLQRGPMDGERLQILQDRVGQPRRNLIPTRGQGSAEHKVALFRQMAEDAAVTIADLGRLEEVPEAVIRFLSQHNLPAEVRLSPEPTITNIDWNTAPTLEHSTGPARAEDLSSVTGALAGVAETGTLVLASGEKHSTTLNFLPDNHIVVLRQSQIVGDYESVWDQVRASLGAGAMPRTVNMITGPSRTGDIEQTIQLGAHGPRRLHIILVGDDD